MLSHRDELLKIDHPIAILVKFLQSLLNFTIAGVKADRADQTAEFVLVDFIVVILVENIERCSHDMKLFARQLRYFHGHRDETWDRKSVYLRQTRG